ncbi:hypothetical protein ACVWZM_005258 [Bradyrhizobium sp. USDA 4501]
MRVIRHHLDEAHPDYAVLSALRDEIAARAGGLEALTARFPELVRDAVDFLLDPVRTARTRLHELDNVEKTFIGLKLEHFVRDMLDVPKGLRDLHINGMDVDIKNTTGDNWSIPQETYNNAEPCLLMAVDETVHQCFLGLIIAKLEYLHGGVGNRDTKRGVSSLGFQHILWIVNGAPFRQSRFMDLDMNRFRELRKNLLGNERAAQFCRENLRRVIHRDVAHALLFDHYDYMKRLRANGGAPDILQHEGIAILIGTYLKDRMMAATLGISNLARDEIVAIAPENDEQRTAMREAGLIV